MYTCMQEHDSFLVYASSNKFIHHEGPCSPCALCSAKANKYTPSKYNGKRNCTHTQTSREGCFSDMYLEGRTDFQTPFATKRSNRGNNHLIGSLPKTQVKEFFTNKSNITSTEALVHGQNILTATMPDYQVLHCH